MLFYAPPPALWTDPSPFPYSRALRWLWARSGWSFLPLRVTGEPFTSQWHRRGIVHTDKVVRGWRSIWRTYQERLDREAEAYQRYLAEVEAYERLMAEYEEQGEHMARMLPLYLHNLKLSYRRTVQDRKTERYRERVDYCEIDEWYFDESAYYFWVNTWDALPYGVTVRQFLEPEIKDTLSANFGSDCFIEFNKRDHQRPGLWVVVQHKAGRGLIPRMIAYSEMLKALPASAPLLSFPVGVGRNGQYYYGDMDELITILVVGSRGAGKSNTINVILTTWLNRVGPDKLRLFLTDLKGGLEFYDYQGIPHLGGDRDHRMRLEKDSELETVRLGQEVMTEPHQVIPCLRYIEAEMNRRFDIMKGRAKKITAYNRKFGDSLSYWVLVVDELATLMDSKQSSEAKTLLSELARKGRAVGIFLILATQIPDKTVLTRQVAGNMDCRMVGRVADGASSALSLGDGSWDAVYLPKDIPGRMIWRWSDKVVVQAPFIPDLVVKKTIRNLIEGRLVDQATAEEQATALELFAYAHESLAGLCSYRDLYNHFRNRISQHKIRTILKNWRVHETASGLGPKIPIGEDEYYLTPAQMNGQGGRLPRQLVKVEEFEADPGLMDLVLSDLRQASRVSQNSQGVTGSNAKTPETGQADPPEPELTL